MTDLTTKEKLEMIVELCKTHNITAYEIGKYTGISNVTAHNILTGANENPKAKTVNAILTYLETKLNDTKMEAEAINTLASTEKRLEDLEKNCDALKVNFKMLYEQLLFLQNNYVALSKRFETEAEKKRKKKN